jgi:hypothetical protein
MRTLLLALCIALSLSACETDAEGPPPTFSPAVQASFEQYMGTLNPALFAVSTDGRAAWWSYCPAHADGCLETGPGSKADVLNRCEKESGGVPCHVYAVGRRIVWKG